MKISVVKIGGKIELYGEIFSSKVGDPDLTANRLTFREITQFYKIDGIGDGFCTLTLDQAKKLYNDLAAIEGIME